MTRSVPVGGEILRATMPDVLKEGVWDGLKRTLRVSPSLFSEMQYQQALHPERWRAYCDEKLLPVFGRGEVTVIVSHAPAQGA